MRRIFDIFRIRRDERWLVLGMLLLFVAMDAMVIYKYYALFTPLKRFYWPLFIRNFHVSGFDPITYSVVSDWTAGYNVYRHPLLAFYMYLPYLLNQGLMALTGRNAAIFIVAAIETACATYAVVFFQRILREVVGLRRADAVLLTLFFFSFAFVLLSAMVPDHFMLSMFLLLLALYVSGRRMRSGRPFKVWQSVVYFLLTAGTSLNNGLKIFLAALFVNRRRFFRPAHLLLAVVLPAALLWGFCRWEYRVLVWPAETARHAAKAKQQAKQKAEEERKRKEIALQQAASGRAVADSTQRAATKAAAERKKPPRRVRQGAPIAQGEFMRWTDITTSRWQSAVENLFGESIQLHEDYLLEDEFRQRPMIVHYRHAWNYVVEAAIVGLFLLGIWCGRRERFLWLVLSWFALDMVLHMGLGFGINEIYIMSAHWIYAIPIAVAYLLHAARGRWRQGVRVAVGVLAAYLWLHNVGLMTKYFLA